MAIVAEEVVVLADVEVLDDYRIGLSTRELLTPLTWSQAEQLVVELAHALGEARAALASDFPGVPPEGAVPHGFDVDGGVS